MTIFSFFGCLTSLEGLLQETNNKNGVVYFKKQEKYNNKKLSCKTLSSSKMKTRNMKKEKAKS